MLAVNIELPQSRRQKPEVRNQKTAAVRVRPQLA
jgi:hypothetical protein